MTIVSLHFIGDLESGFGIRANIGKLMEGSFVAMGKAMATMLVQGGEAPAIFKESVVDLFFDQDPGIETLLADLEPHVREQLKKVTTYNYVLCTNIRYRDITGDTDMLC